MKPRHCRPVIPRADDAMLESHAASLACAQVWSAKLAHQSHGGGWPVIAARLRNLVRARTVGKVTGAVSDNPVFWTTCARMLVRSPYARCCRSSPFSWILPCAVGYTILGDR